ncbi:hypothetical protein LC040_05940 [Bacillus tianshenii]|nr:hypothetical protein LC040_05940 [Bacillus tianshenii]
MKHQLNLTQAENAVCMQAMNFYTRIAPSSVQAQADIAFEKLVLEEEMDGMEMRILVKALRRNAQFFASKRKWSESDILNELANLVDEERQVFQQRNNPLAKEKAASAGTLTA